MIRPFWTLAALVLFIVPEGPVHAVPARPVTEYEVKAAFLNNFVKFTEWPESTLAPGDTLVFGVLGDGPMHEELARIVRNRSAQERPMALRRVFVPVEAAACHVMFVHEDARRRFRDMAAGLEMKPVLTVGETRGFLQSGGVINFVIRQSRIQFEVNARAGERAGLVLRSQLLRLGAAHGDKASNEN